MKMFGGIIAVLSGLLGSVVAGLAIYILFSGTWHSSDYTFVFLSATGVTIFSLLVILLGILILLGQSTMPGILLMLLSILGAMMIVRFISWLSLFMFLPFFGGFLAVLGIRRGKAPAAQGAGDSSGDG